MSPAGHAEVGGWRVTAFSTCLRTWGGNRILYTALPDPSSRGGRACSTIVTKLPPASCYREGQEGNETAVALSIGAQLRRSASLSSGSYSVTSWRVFAIGALLAVASLLMFQSLANGMAAAAVQQAFMGSSAELLFLDLRFGYTPEEAWTVLERWGPHGRQLYLGVEAIDCLLYHTGYRAAGLVMINRLEAEFGRRWPSLHGTKHLAAIPFLLATLDFSEDMGQVRVLLPRHPFIFMVAMGRPTRKLAHLQQSEPARPAPLLVLPS